MRIRQATMADLDNITEVENICFPPQEAASRDSLAKRLEVFFESFLVLEDNGQIIGFINGGITYDRVVCDEMYKDATHHKPDGDYQAVFGLVVIPEYRGRDLAKSLMNEFINRTRARGKKGLILTCKEHLMEFYCTFGFENLGHSNSKHGGAVWCDMILEF
jgi:ribosomal protein S18 acetylase RimI-like enzyme